MPLQDKVILITGAASGIGASAALKLASLSARLALVDKNEPSLLKTLELCEKNSGKSHLKIVADLNNINDVLTVIPKTIECFGKIDVLINCAGILSSEKLPNDDVAEKFDLIIGVNLKAPIVLMNKAAPHLIESKGNIINICSISTVKPSRKRLLYGVSKAGLEMYTKSAALELASVGVRVNAISPGSVRTKLYLSCDPSVNIEESYEKLVKMLPFGIIEPEEVAKLIVYLADDETARSITGATFTIDGGLSNLQFAQWN